MAKLPTVNLYQSYPIADSYHKGNTTGIIRYIKADDSFTLAPFQRLQGDIMHRFILIEAAHNVLINFINANPFITGLDEAPYIRMDGTRDFSAAQKGIDGEDPAHLTTRAYVDSVGVAAATGAAAVASSLAAFKAITPYTFQSAWHLYTWAAGQKTVLDLTILPNGSLTPNYEAISSVRILEKLDIAQPTQSNPNPAAEYVYRELSATNKAFAIDDYWLIPATGKVRLLIPNQVSYDSGYSGSQNDKLANPRYRWLKAVIEALKS